MPSLDRDALDIATWSIRVWPAIRDLPLALAESTEEMHLQD
jgi:hypothetical protein